MTEPVVTDDLAERTAIAKEALDAMGIKYGPNASPQSLMGLAQAITADQGNFYDKALAGENPSATNPFDITSSLSISAKGNLSEATLKEAFNEVAHTMDENNMDSKYLQQITPEAIAAELGKDGNLNALILVRESSSPSDDHAVGYAVIRSDMGNFHVGDEIDLPREELDRILEEAHRIGAVKEAVSNDPALMDKIMNAGIGIAEDHYIVAQDGIYQKSSPEETGGLYTSYVRDQYLGTTEAPAANAVDASDNPPSVSPPPAGSDGLNM